MADITVRGIPEDVYEELKEHAERRRRSLNQEIVHRLEASVRVPRLEPEAHLQQVRETRGRLEDLPPVDDDFLERARREGRP